LSKQAVKGKRNQAKPEEPVIQAPPPPPAQDKQKLIFIGAAAAGLIVSLAIYVLRLDKVVGLVVDDAWYVLLAKALATGQGYTLVNSPTPGITPFYAPAFPFLLSIFYRLSPNFPNNIWLLKSVSIVAMMGVGALAYTYFKRDRELPPWVALGLALATTIYPALVFLATSTVMSECVFTLAQLGVIVLVERGVKTGQLSSAWQYAVAAGALASFAFLTRPAGVGLLVGAMLYLLKEKLFKQAVIFAGLVALLVGPWMIYSRTHAPTPEQRAEQGANIVQSYSTQLWQRVAGQPLSGTITAGDLPERIWRNLSEIGKYDFGGLVFYSLFRPLEPSLPMRLGQEGRMISLFFAALAIIGFISAVRERMTLAEFVTPLSIGVTMLWGWEQYRLLLPLVPFLLFYILMGVRFFAGLYQKLYDEPKPRGALIPLLIFSWLFVLSNLYANYQYIQRKYDPIPANGLRWISTYEENEAFIKHIGENVPKTDVIATQNPALVHLYTGHKTVASDDPAGSWETWNRLHVRYLARTSPGPLPPPDANEGKYRNAFRQSGALNLRLVDLGDPSSRPAWGKN
jgi:hypothetical protein